MSSTKLLKAIGNFYEKLNQNLIGSYEVYKMASIITIQKTTFDPLKTLYAVNTFKRFIVQGSQFCKTSY